MEHFTVTGMSCAACQARVEKAVSAVPGVESCAVSLLTNSMRVDGTAKNTDIIRAVEKAGYGAKIRGEEKKTSAAEDALKSKPSAVSPRTLAGLVELSRYVDAERRMRYRGFVKKALAETSAECRADPFFKMASDVFRAYSSASMRLSI